MTDPRGRIAEGAWTPRLPGDPTVIHRDSLRRAWEVFARAMLGQGAHEMRQAEARAAFAAGAAWMASKCLSAEYPILALYDLADQADDECEAAVEAHRVTLARLKQEASHASR